MQIDGRLAGNSGSFETEICIIGAGAAGITLARELRNTGVDICLVESGGLTVTAENQDLADGANVGHTYFPLNTTRLRVFGGSTGHWTGWCRPMEAIDFERRDWVPESGWPYGLEELIPFYERAQTIMQIGPYNYLPENWESLSNSPWPFTSRSAGTGQYQSPRIVNRMIQFSPPVRFSEAYGDALFGADNIRVFLDSPVTTINADANGSRIKSVSISPLSGKPFNISAKHFILCAGGLDNARILLLSDEVHNNGLGNQHDLVGRYFMNHTWCEASGIVASMQELQAAFYEYGQTVAKTENGQDVNVQGFFALSRETQAREGILNLSLVPTPRADLRALFTQPKDKDRWFSRLGRAIGGIDQLVSQSVRNTLSRSSEYPVFGLVNEIEQAPNPDSRVTLTHELDVLGQRKLQLDWRMTELDIRSLARGQEILGAELARNGLGRIVAPIDPDSGWPTGQIGNWHHIGTTRMHDSPNKGVVNANCTVHGISNLHVAGSSVFPTAGYCNPTLTIVALAIKLADHLKTQLAA